MSANTKHIVLVNHTRELHGSEQVMLETLRLLRAQGWRVTLVLPFNRPAAGLEEAVGTDAEILYLRYKNSGEGWLRTLLVELYNLPALIRFIRWIHQNRLDAIYSNTSVTLLGIEAARMTRTPHIWHWHELPSAAFGWPNNSLPILRYWQRFTDRLLFISRTQQQLWQRALGRNALTNAQVVYNPARTIRVTRTANSGTVRIGYIGSFADRKNLPWLIQSVRQLAAQYDVRLSLYGATNEQEIAALKALWPDTSAMRVQRHTSEVEKVYADMDIFVLPSLSETMPLVVLEAMQAGVCVIQTDRSGMKELMHDGEECLFVQPDDKDSLTRALTRSMDAEYRNAIATRGQQFAEHWLAENDYGRSIMTVFNELLTHA